MATILCVESEPSVGVAFEHTLSKIGHRPVLVSSVEDALKTVARTPVDLIVADYVMPRPNGLDLLKLLEKEGYRIPVIVMTSHSSLEAFRRVMEVIAAPGAPPSAPPPLAEMETFNLDEIKRRTIDRALAATGGNRTRAAKLLGISERTLRNRLNMSKAAAPET
jgi:DNA-binding NtrC family response regulator